MMENLGVKKKYYCSKCKTFKSISEFNKSKLTFCKQCRREYNKQYYKEKHEKIKAHQREYGANHRAEELERVRTWRRENPEKRKAQDLAYYQRNKDKEAERKAKYRNENLDKVRELARQSYHRNKHKGNYSKNYKIRQDRILSNGGAYSTKEWTDLCEAYNYTCLCCERKEPEIKLTPDHVVPLVLGGSSNIDNIQPLCETCNKVKGVKVIDYRTKGEDNHACSR
jgi:5-methylcytosine-specific restriction endonuclease McrA